MQFAPYLSDKQVLLFFGREMEEITTFIRGAICEDQCLGRCLYIHGVPGTGKVSIGLREYP